MTAAPVAHFCPAFQGSLVDPRGIRYDAGTGQWYDEREGGHKVITRCPHCGQALERPAKA